MEFTFRCGIIRLQYYWIALYLHMGFGTQENLSLGFFSRSISNLPAQLHGLARMVEFGMKQVQISYFAGNK